MPASTMRQVSSGPQMATDARLNGFCGPFFPSCHMDYRNLVVAYASMPVGVYGDKLREIFGRAAGCEGTDHGPTTSDGYFWPLKVTFRTDNGGTILLLCPKRDSRNGSTDRYPAFYVSGPVGSNDVEALAFNLHQLLCDAARKH